MCAYGGVVGQAHSTEMFRDALFKGAVGFTYVEFVAECAADDVYQV